VYLEKVEIGQPWVDQILTEAGYVDLVVSIEVEVASKLVIEGISDEDPVVVEDVPQV
jgi:hypothetical protein